MVQTPFRKRATFRRVAVANVDVQPMTDNFKSTVFGDFDLQAFDFIVLELEHLAASDTNHVIVMIAGGALVTLHAVAELTHFDQTDFDQNSERPVDRGKADRAVLFTHFSMKIFSAEVPLSGEHDPKDLLALFGQTQTTVKQLVLKPANLLFNQTGTDRHNSSSPLRSVVNLKHERGVQRDRVRRIELEKPSGAHIKLDTDL